MATRDSMIKAINRGLKDYAARLGTASAEYQQLVAALRHSVGVPAHHDANGVPVYTRAKHRAYDITQLTRAYQQVTGQNTASRKEQPYIKKLQGMQVSPTRANVQRLARIFNEVTDRREALYQMYKLMSTDPLGTPTHTLGVKGVAMFRDLGANAQSMTIQDVLQVMAHDHETLGVWTGQDFLETMDNILQHAGVQSTQRKSQRAANARSSTKGGKIII